jgi:hypothetical protein
MFDDTFIKSLMTKKNCLDFICNRNDTYKMAKQKHKNVYVFYKNNNVIILDKRNRYPNVYSSLDSASKKLIV